MIPEHQRRNHEHTDDLLHDARVLLTALESADDEAPARNNLDRYAQAVPALIRMVRDKLEEIEKARAAEWVGIGGVSESLTKDEAAAALEAKPFSYEGAL